MSVSSDISDGSGNGDDVELCDDKSDILTRTDIDVQDMLSVLSDLYDKELVGIIGWAKQIPGKFGLACPKLNSKFQLSVFCFEQDLSNCRLTIKWSYCKWLGLNY